MVDLLIMGQPKTCGMKVVAYDGQKLPMWDCLKLGLLCEKFRGTEVLIGLSRSDPTSQNISLIHYSCNQKINSFYEMITLHNAASGFAL